MKEKSRSEEPKFIQIKLLCFGGAKAFRWDSKPKPWYGNSGFVWWLERARVGVLLFGIDFWY